MFSKRHVVLALIFCSLGCQRLIGEKAAVIPSPSNNIGTEARCISQSATTLKRFFNGETSSYEVSTAWNCFDGAMELFAKKVRGTKADFYRPSEISDFLEGYVLSDGHHLSAALMTEVLRLKQFLVGGSVDQLTREELIRLRAMIQQFRLLTVELAPLMKVYSGRWDWKSTQSMVQARAEFSAAEVEFAARLKRLWPQFHGQYDLKDLSRLSEALQESFPQTTSLARLSNTFKKYSPLLISAKNILLNDQQSTVAPADWSTLVIHLPAIYSRYLYGKYFLEDKILWGESLSSFETVIQSSLSCLATILESRGKGVAVGISVLELNQLAEGLGSAGLLGDLFTVESLKAVIPVAIQRLLTPPEKRLTGESERALGLVALQTFSVEFLAFIDVQKKLNEIWNPRELFTHGQLQDIFKGSTGSLAEMATLLESPLSYAFDSDGRIFFDVQTAIPYSQDSLMRMNVARTLVRLAIRSYAGDVKRVETLAGLTKKEFQQDFFTDLRPFLIGAGLIDPANTVFARNRFIEANLFTPLGNGDEFLDFHEGSGITLMIWSGMNLNSQFIDAIKQKCTVGTSSPALYGADCAMEQMRQMIPVIATSVPSMAMTINRLPEADAQKMLMDLLKAAGWLENPERLAKMSDIGLVPHVLQYIESVFRRWDLNKDGIIDKDEAMLAETTFRPILSSVSGQTDPGVLRAAFAYILTYQKNPLSDPFGFFDFMGDETQWKIHMDRPVVGKVLGFIADQLRAKTSKEGVRISEL